MKEFNQRRAQNDKEELSFSYYDKLRASIPINKVTRIDASTVLKVAGTRLIHLACAFGFSRSSASGSSLQSSMFSSAKGAMMAAYDFNTGNDVIVPGLKQLTKDCDVKITLDFYDTGRVARIGAAVLSQHIHKQQFPYQTSAVVGAVRSAVSVPMAVLNSVRNIPQVSYASTSSSLDDRGPYRMFGRVIPSNDGDARAAMDFFVTRMNSRYIGILYVNDDYGTAYRNSLERAASAVGVKTQAVSVNWSSESVRGSVHRAVNELMEIGYRHFVGIIFQHHLESLIELGTPRGLMGPGKFWLFGDGISTSSVSSLKYRKESSMADALQGLSILSIGDASTGGHFGRFMERFDELRDDVDFMQYFESKSPIASDVVKFHSNWTFDSPSQFPPLAYDAVVSLGIAACQSEKEFFTGPELFNEFLQISFIGASGPIRINPATGSRSLNTSAYVLHNTLVTDPDENGMVGLTTVIAGEYGHPPGDIDGSFRWFDRNGGFNFSGGTMIPPPDLPFLEQDFSYRSTVTVLLSSVGVLIMISALAFAVWTWYYRESHVIKASQPFFLLAICGGVFCMSFTVIMFGSSTNPDPYSRSWANFSCMGSYWFFALGFGLSFSALFSKTWRIVKILGGEVHRFRRIVVEPKDVILPAVFITLGNFLIPFVWQLVDPLHYEVVDDTGASVDRFGRLITMMARCSSEKGLYMYFIGALFALNGCIVLAAIVQAYRARHITTEFSESRYIALANGIILQALVLSLPVFFYETTNEIVSISKQLLAIVTSSSILFLIFVPKVGIWLRHRKLVLLRAQIKKEKKDRVRANGELVPHSSDDHEEVTPSVDFASVIAGSTGLQIISISRSPLSPRRSRSDVSSGVRARHLESSMPGVSCESGVCDPEDENDKVSDELNVSLPTVLRENSESRLIKHRDNFISAGTAEAGHAVEPNIPMVACGADHPDSKVEHQTNTPRKLEPSPGFGNSASENGLSTIPEVQTRHMIL